MTSILCCRIKRKASTTWLNTTIAHFDFELLFEAYCPNCKHAVMAFCGFSYKEGRFPEHRIRRKHQHVWLARKKVDFHFYEAPGYKLPKDTRPLVFVSEATLKMSRDVSRQCKLK